IQETAHRICDAKAIDLPSVNVLWAFTLPRLANPLDLAELGRGLRDHTVEVLLLDPLYLSLLAGATDLSATNLYQTRPLLLAVARTCLDAGCTPILLHHCRMHTGNDGEPGELEDLAYSGVQEFSRQWLIITRRQAYEAGSGMHRLWLSVGGSAGQSG